MDGLTITLVAALAIALIMAWSARRKAAAALEQVETLRREALMKDGEVDELKPAVEGLRKLVAMMAAGRDVDPDMVKENRLFRSVTAIQLQSTFEKGEEPYVIDVRSPEEWASGHIPCAVHIPVDALEKRLHEVARDGRNIYVTCAGGGRSSVAADYLSNRGYLNIYNVDGGMNSWRGEVVRGA